MSSDDEKSDFQIHEGMHVYGADGEKLGKVISRDAGSFIIEKGLIFTKDFIVRDEDVEQVLEDELWLRRSGSELAPSENTPGQTGTMGVPPPISDIEQSPLLAGGAQAEILGRRYAAGDEGKAPLEGRPPDPGEVHHDPERKVHEERTNYEREANNAPRREPADDHPLT